MDKCAATLDRLLVSDVDYFPTLIITDDELSSLLLLDMVLNVILNY